MHSTGKRNTNRPGREARRPNWNREQKKSRKRKKEEKKKTGPRCTSFLTFRNRNRKCFNLFFVFFRLLIPFRISLAYWNRKCVHVIQTKAVCAPKIQFPQIQNSFWMWETLNNNFFQNFGKWELNSEPYSRHTRQDPILFVCLCEYVRRIIQVFFIIRCISNAVFTTNSLSTIFRSIEHQN